MFSSALMLGVKLLAKMYYAPVDVHLIFNKFAVMHQLFAIHG
jgi:hypothetical protein